jgi:hypothetical protein
VFRIAGGDENLAALLEMFEDAFREPFVVQRYLPEVGPATSASSSSTARSPAPSTACRRPARRAPTCTSAARPSRPN